MALEVSVRRATPADVEAILALFEGLFIEDAGRWDPFVNRSWAMEYGAAYFTSALAQDGYVCFLATGPDGPVGYLIGSLLVQSTFRPVPVAEMESMFVAETARGQGIGTRLARAFRDWAWDHGAERLQVMAYASNARAIAFYRRLGFEAWKLTLEMSAL